MTNEEKLNEVYSMLKAQEARASRDFWFGILKLCIIGGGAYWVATNPGYLIGRVMDVVQPIVMEQMKSVMATQKEELLKQTKDLIPGY